MSISEGDPETRTLVLEGGAVRAIQIDPALVVGVEVIGRSPQ